MSGKKPPKTDRAKVCGGGGGGGGIAWNHGYHRGMKPEAPDHQAAQDQLQEQRGDYFLLSGKDGSDRGNCRLQRDIW